jgi:type II secretory pathway component PulM
MILEQYKQLNKREQKLLFFVVFVLFLSLIYFFIYSPIDEKNKTLNRQIELAENDLKWASVSAQKIIANRMDNRTSLATDDRTLLSRISEVIKRHGIRGMEFSTKTTNKVELEVKNVSFIKLHQAIYELESKWGVIVDAANIRKIEGKADTVNVSLKIVNHSNSK